MSSSTSVDSVLTKLTELTKGVPEWLLLATCGASTFVLVCLICCCCCCCRRRRAKKNDTLTSIDVPAPKWKTNMKIVQPGAANILERQELAESLASRGMKAKQTGAGGVGKIQISLSYDFDAGELTLVMIQAADLKAMDSSGTSDPFVKVYLLPDKIKYETRTIKKTLNPVFNETYVFKIPYKDVASKTLHFKVYDQDRVSNDLIGECKIALQTIDLTEMSKKWMFLTTAEEELGEICFSLRFLPLKGKLEVNILEAKDLKKMDVWSSSDPYVKIELFEGNKRSKKQKTSTKMRNLNPYYNETFSFKVTEEQVQLFRKRKVKTGRKTVFGMLSGANKQKEPVSLIITVVDYDRIGTSEPIGRVLLGGSSTGKELRHWRDMLANPRRPITQWHTLQEVPKKG